MIVVDTTVWIDFFQGAETPEDLHLQRLITEGKSLALIDLIFYPILRMEQLATFEHAARIYRTCRRRGLTVRKTIDCLIAALCIEEDIELFHKDADFDAIARIAPLKVYRLPRGQARGPLC